MAITTKVGSSGSAFPELLRRSRFASFDPTICQSYGTPPSHLHRGNWGLKRPIAQRKRNAFISLKNFEEHQHYIEWNNAESQVRLVNRVEELNVAPKLVPHTPWYVGLGPAASTPWSMTDSEFAIGESGMPPPSKSIPSFTTELEGLGLRGKGEYGMKPSTKPGSDDGYLHPNLQAMSPRVFNRYIKKLRSLRPQFKNFLKENGVSTPIRESGVPPGNLHIRFLGQHFDKQFQDIPNKNNSDPHPNQSQPIRQQPHRLGGLMYASPTYLESFFSSGIQPAIVLEAASQQNFSDKPDSFLVSTAGFIGKLEQKRAGPDACPVFDPKGIIYPPAALVAGQIPRQTFIQVRVLDLHLERLPAAVTAFPSPNSSKDVNIRMDLAIHPYPNQHSRTNPHPPGSMEYNAPEDSYQKRPITTFNRSVDRYKLYQKKLGNRLHEEDDDGKEIGRTGHFGRNGVLSKLVQLQHNKKSTERPEQGAMGMSWNRPWKRSWHDDEWIDGPNPEKEEK